jgi:hypothetical protein
MQNSIEGWDLVGFDYGATVSPNLFETVREQLDGRGAFRVPNQKAGCRGAEFTDHPKNISHALPPLLRSDSDPCSYDAPGGLDAARL